jgi:hypothetical protein
MSFTAFMIFVAICEISVRPPSTYAIFVLQEILLLVRTPLASPNYTGFKNITL